MPGVLFPLQPGMDRIESVGRRMVTVPRRHQFHLVRLIEEVIQRCLFQCLIGPDAAVNSDRGESRRATKAESVNPPSWPDLKPLGHHES